MSQLGPILITGLPRSGTTTLTATFASHPELVLYTSGRQRDRLECAELLPEHIPDFERIRALHDGLKAGRLLIKRPWLHSMHNASIRRFARDSGARIIIAVRDKRALKCSWEGTGRKAVTDSCRQSIDAIFAKAMDDAFALEREGIAITTFLPFLPSSLRTLEMERLAAWTELPSGMMSFRSCP